MKNELERIWKEAVHIREETSLLLVVPVFQVALHRNHTQWGAVDTRV
jgi:hypothetical protein